MQIRSEMGLQCVRITPNEGHLAGLLSLQKFFRRCALLEVMPHNRNQYSVKVVMGGSK